MVFLKELMLCDVSSHVWDKVEKLGYSKNKVMKAFEKHYNELTQEHVECIKERVIKNLEAIDIYGASFLVSLEAYNGGCIHFEPSFQFGVEYDPKKPDMILIYRYAEGDLLKDIMEEYVEWRSEKGLDTDKDSLTLENKDFVNYTLGIDDTLSDVFNSHVAFFFTCVAFILEECFKEEIYGSEACRKRTFELADKGYSVSEAIRTLRSESFVNLDILAIIEECVGDVKLNY